MYHNPAKATIDFETRSTCNLGDSGSWRYSLHAGTEVLCLAYRLPYWEHSRTGLWHPAMPHLDIDEGDDFEELSELFAWVMTGGLVEAHNAWFERGVWTNKMTGWPRILPHQWRCSAAKAAAHTLPRGMRGAAKVLGLDVHKDDAALRTALDLDGETTRVMTKMSQPRKPKKSDVALWRIEWASCDRCHGDKRVPSFKKDGSPTVRGEKCPVCGGLGYNRRRRVPRMPLLWHESKELMQELWVYCRQDVLAEEALSAELPDLSPEETEVYLLDQTINERGFALDIDAIDAALTLIDGECVELNAELRELTHGEVEKATQRVKMRNWFDGRGLWLPDTTGATIDAALTRTDLAPDVHRGLELVRTLGRSSTAKYEKMSTWVCPDTRVHGGLLYHGAGTGRWSGAGVQPHNFPKGALSGPLKGESQDVLWPVLKTRDAEQVRSKYGKVMEALSHGLRGAIVAGEGMQLYVADYSSIEARVVLWLADDEAALEIFRTGADIYCYMADDVYGYPTNKHDHPKERGVGKIAVLGLGYQMGASKFVETCAAGGVIIPEDHYCAFVDGPGAFPCGEGTRWHTRRDCDHDFVFADGVDPKAITAVKVVDAYRTKFWRVKAMWSAMENAAIMAVRHPDTLFETNHTSWFIEDRFLYCALPSGRRLAYPEPVLRSTTLPWGKVVDELSFSGINVMTHQWGKQYTYGGSLVENVTQAVARDVMAEAMVRCEKSGLYLPVLTVHDEIVAEAPLGTGDVKEFEALLTETPTWAVGCPIGAEGWTGTRYHK